MGRLNRVLANVVATPTLDLGRKTTAWSHDAEFGGCRLCFYPREDSQLIRIDSICTFFCILHLKVPRALYAESNSYAFQ